MLNEYGLTAIFRRVRALILRREVEIVGQCKLCGDCCHDIMLHDKGKWIKTEKQFQRLCTEDPRHERFDIVGKEETGQLTFACTRQADEGFCTCYDDRMPLCRNYPNKSLYYRGGWLRADCGFSFKPTTFRDVFMRRRRAKIPPFADVLKQEKDKA